MIQSAAPDDRLRFHPRCGTLVKLSPNSRSAKRLRAYDEFNNGVVMTNRNLLDDELFEVRTCVRTLVNDDRFVSFRRFASINWWTSGVVASR